MPRARLTKGLRSRIAADPFARRLGITLLALRPGYSRMRLALDASLANFQGIVHGGAIFSLADAAFAAASNSHGDPAVALAMSIQFLNAPRAGSGLVAEAREQRLGRRAGFYAMTVVDDAGTTIATCQGVVHRRPERTRRRTR
ncbi:MAG: PaaI family thioesterase [Armatimonadota bacterium]